MALPVFAAGFVHGTALAAGADGPPSDKFEYLSTSGNSNCSAEFMDSIADMPDDARLQGFCCSPMVRSRYHAQVQGLKRYAAFPEIPPDPYDISAGLAKAATDHYDDGLSLAQQGNYQYAMDHSNENGPCCCECWRWRMYGGLAKTLIRERRFTGRRSWMSGTFPMAVAAREGPMNSANTQGEQSASGWRRRSVLGALAASTLLPLLGSAVAAADRAPPPEPEPTARYPLFYEAQAAVIPWQGYQSAIALKDCLVRLTAHAVLDRDKYLALNGGRAAMSDSWVGMLDRASDVPLYLTADNAAPYVDLLWPVGLANRLHANRRSPLLGDSIDDFVSTGGWTLGRAATGGRYFNRYRIVDLTADQEALAVAVAKTTFRPCCDNSTFFQDCNHGSALFGVLQLGASQGLDEQALHREALAFNSFWFPDTYVLSALYFKVYRHTDWLSVNPKLVMGPDYSTATRWQKNVFEPLQSVRHLIPPPTADVNCGA